LTTKNDNDDTLEKLKNETPNRGHSNVMFRAC